MAKKQKQQAQNIGELIGDANSTQPLPKDVRAELLHNIEVLNKLLFSPNAKLRDAARAINEMLTIVENILLSAFFKEYEQWITKSGGDINELPNELVTLGEKIHKLIVARGKLVMDMMQQIKEDEEAMEEKQRSTQHNTNKELFSLPQELVSYLEDDGSNE